MEKQKWGILLSTPPDHPNLTTVYRLATEALHQGIDTYIYLIDEGVRTLPEGKVRELSQKGAKLFACAYGATRRGIPITDEAQFCGLVVLSDLVRGCDRFLSFN